MASCTFFFVTTSVEVFELGKATLMAAGVTIVEMMRKKQQEEHYIVQRSSVNFRCP